MNNRGDRNQKFYSWRDKNVVRYELTLNRKNEADVIDFLDLQQSRRGYIINLVRKDLAEKNQIIEERKRKRKEEKKKNKPPYSHS